MLKATALLISIACTVFIAQEAGAKPKSYKPEPKPPVCEDFKKSSCLKAPEIDASAAMAGLTILAGGIAVMLGRKRLRTEAG